jgi:hypothetical protein
LEATDFLGFPHVVVLQLSSVGSEIFGHSGGKQAIPGQIEISHEKVKQGKEIEEIIAGAEVGAIMTLAKTQGREKDAPFLNMPQRKLTALQEAQKNNNAEA